MVTDSDNTNTGDASIKIRCIAIDDEPLALIQLKSMIERTPYLTLVGACSDVAAARKIIGETEFDALFLDINMPDTNGLEFVASLPHTPLVVFTTAYSQYAVESYKVNAIDYLLKPFGMPEFEKAAEKVKRQFQLLMAEKNAGPSNARILCFKIDSKLTKINADDIVYIESMREYICLNMADKKQLITLMKVSEVAERLASLGFQRIHRSYIVNMNWVKEVSRNSVRLGNGTTLPIGDSFKKPLKNSIL